MLPKRIRICLKCQKTHTHHIIDPITNKRTDLKLCKTCLFNHEKFSFDVNLNLYNIEKEILKDENV